MKNLWILGALALLPVVANAKPRQEKVADRIERRVESDPQLRGFNFNAQTVGNHIDLRGTVRNQNQRRRAIQIARQSAGRFQVNNLISVSGNSRR